MEIVKYICEFFFGNFWHFLGLFVIILAVCDTISIFPINIGKKNNNEEGK